MNGRKIYTIGETVFDILFKDGQALASKAGGAMLNASVSLGRLGLPVQLISEIGRDRVGEQILGFLNRNHVGTSFIHRYVDGQTALAVAFLDEQEEAHYSFYKNYPVKRMDLKYPRINHQDIVLFGSFFSIAKEVRSILTSFLYKARKAGAIILYDPNFRSAHQSKLEEFLGFIQENMALADIVRGSSDDFRMIFNVGTADAVYDKVGKEGEKIVICTSGSGKVQFRSANHSFQVPVPRIEPLSTIGAGDNFNAGLIYSLYKLNVLRLDLFSLKKQEWQAMVDSGITFGSSVCETFENYISTEFAEKIRIA